MNVAVSSKENSGENHMHKKYKMFYQILKAVH